MWERFSLAARRTIFFAQEEAKQLGENYMSTEHLLLGLLRDNNDAGRILESMGLRVARVRAEIYRQIGRGDGPTKQDIQITPRGKRVIDLAFDEARQLQDNFIGTEHLLLGLIREDEGLAARILQRLRVNLTYAREVTRSLKDQKAETASVFPVRDRETITADGPASEERPVQSNIRGRQPTMWQRFTELARRVIYFAQEESVRLGENYVSTEHLLLGLIREENVARRILESMGISVPLIRAEIERHVARGDGSTKQDMQLTPRAKRVIDLAYDEARQLNNNYIGTEHLLLGLIREGEGSAAEGGGLAARVLRKLGVDLDRTRREVIVLQDQEAKTPSASIQRDADTVTADDPSSAERPVENSKKERPISMWQRFTERSRRVVFFAQEEAGRLGQNHVAPEHLLLGLVRENDSVAARILDGLGVKLGHIRSEIERQISRGEKNSDQMQLTPLGKRVIDLAYDEARKLNNNYIGTEHLLLALIRLDEGIVANVMAAVGVTYDPTLQAVKELQASADNAPEQPGQTTSSVRVRPGDLGVAQSNSGQDYVEVAHDAAAFVELVNVFQAKDAHGYRSLLQGDQTMFVIPVGTPIKLLVTPAGGDLARDRGGRFIRVLAGDFVGYSGWIFSEAFVRTGPDENSFPPSLGD